MPETLHSAAATSAWPTGSVLSMVTTVPASGRRTNVSRNEMSEGPLMDSGVSKMTVWILLFVVVATAPPASTSTLTVVEPSDHVIVPA